MSLSFKAFTESFPLAREFRISRGAKTQADVITVLVSDGHYYGWGESVPYARYNESIESVLAQLKKKRAPLPMSVTPRIYSPCYPPDLHAMRWTRPSGI